MRTRAGVARGLGHDHAEGGRVDGAGAGEGGEEAAGGDELEAQDVDVLVAAEGLLGELLGVGELRRVEHHEVEVAGTVAEAAELLEDVALDELGLGQAVEGGVAAGLLQRGAGEINVRDGRGTGDLRGDTKAAGVTEGVEDTAALGGLGDQAAVLALVQVEAGLVALADVDLEADGTFVNDDALGRLGTCEQTA